MELLYEARSKGDTVSEIIASLPMAPDDYASRIALGAGDADHEVAAMELIRRFARKDWPVDRLPALDVIILRLAIEELTHQPDVPKAVVIDEAVELAKLFSTEDSGRFVNGMLTSIADDLGRVA
jgi:transcription antitermination protein NusB